MLIIFLCIFFSNYCMVRVARPSLDDYCKHSDQNTPCLYRCKDNYSDCGKVKLSEPFTTKQKRLVLDLHNEFRNKVASGEYVIAGIPAAGNMHVLSYDKECEFLAACWMHQCVLDHDQVRLTLANEMLGQNFYSASSTSDTPVSDEFVEKAITSWFNEHKLIEEEDRDIFKSYQEKDIQINNFTAMVWEKTLYVGCSVLSHRREHPMYTTDLFCNYKPKGNIDGESVIAEASGSDKCKDVNDKYPNLCGNIRIMAVDPYICPIEGFLTETAQDYNDPDYVEENEDLLMINYEAFILVGVAVAIILTTVLVVVIIQCLKH